MIAIAAWSAQRRAIQARVDNQPIRLCEFSSPHDVFRMLSDRVVSGLVITVGAAGLRAVEVISQAAAIRALSVPVLVDVPPDPLAFRHVLELSRTVSDLRISLQMSGPVDLVLEIQKMDPRTSSQSRDRVASQLVPLVPRALADILIPAIVIGDRRTSPRTIETVSGVSGRTIRHGLSSAGLPSPGKILGLVAGCRVAHDTEIHNLSLAIVASRTGFGSEDALRDYLKARTGLSPSRWKAAGFAKSLDLVCSRLSLSGDG